MTQPTWTIELPLCPEAKGNSRRIMRRGVGGARFIGKSEKAETFTRTAVMLIRAQGHPSPFTHEDKIRFWGRIRYPDYRRDVDVEMIKDALETAGVVPNDRQIRCFDYEAEDEVGDPRIRIRLTRVGPLPWKSKAKGGK